MIPSKFVQEIGDKLGLKGRICGDYGVDAMADHLENVRKSHLSAVEQLTREQFIHAVSCAVTAGDFMRLSTPDGAQTVIYSPYVRCRQLESENSKLTAQIEAIRQLVESYK